MGAGGGGDNPCGNIAQTPDETFSIAFGGDATSFTFDPASGTTNCILTGAGFNAEFWNNTTDNKLFRIIIGTLSLGFNYLGPGVSVTADGGASISAKYEGPTFDFSSLDIGGYAFVSGNGTANDPFIGCLYDVTTLPGIAGTAGMTATAPSTIPIVCKAAGQ